MPSHRGAVPQGRPCLGGAGPRQPCCGTVGRLSGHDGVLLTERRGILGDGIHPLIATEAAVEWHPLQDELSVFSRQLSEPSRCQSPAATSGLKVLPEGLLGLAGHRCRGQRGPRCAPGCRGGTAAPLRGRSSWHGNWSRASGLPPRFMFLAVRSFNDGSRAAVQHHRLCRPIGPDLGAHRESTARCPIATSSLCWSVAVS